MCFASFFLPVLFFIYKYLNKYMYDQFVQKCIALVYHSCDKLRLFIYIILNYERDQLF
ncbi:unnamed protein product [Schistosoma margrebowiei]|uniref:Uncharacterized protein n=1 Tax=Schistosoma margrebowiei TaxID=48269 RepID=A0A183MNQ2_9TREM|nr:unnamed protein product [Schistosoma margrebowiei]